MALFEFCTAHHKKSSDESLRIFVVEHCQRQSNPDDLFQILRQIPSTAQHTVDFHSLYFIVDAVEHKILVNDHPTISRVKVVDLAHFRGIA